MAMRVAVFILLLLAASPAQALPIFESMYPAINPTVVPVPSGQPWGFVSVSIENNVASFEVGIYEVIIPYFQPGFEPQVEFFWFNYSNQIQPGDIVFNSTLNWVTNPVDTLAGNRGAFDYQIFAGFGHGEQVLKFQIHNLQPGVTESDFFHTVNAGPAGVDGEFRISMNNIAQLPSGGTSGMHLVNFPVPEPSTLLFLGSGIGMLMVFRKRLSHSH